MHMATRIGINGFGRIGRNAARIICESQGVTLAAINSLSDASSHAYLLKHDSVQGVFSKNVTHTDSGITVDGHEVMCFWEKDASLIPWDKAQVDVVLECTGRARTGEDAKAHLERGVKAVVISSPVKDSTPTYIMGVNHTLYKKERVISNSSCTTNCVTTVLKVLDDAYGVIRGNMTTIHAATDSQNILDNSHKKETRLRRSSLVNLIPAASGSSGDVAKLFPHLLSKLPCRAIRVPVPTVSLIDLVVEVKKPTTVSEVNAAYKEASTKVLKGILTVAGEELVSSDYIGSPYSAVVDPFLTDVVDGTLVHVTAWYDNEWGYTNRLVELASYIVPSL
jgi:glyceraldehyde 3-phosphate dehydrogenase